MTDYTQPPTEEFKHITERGFHDSAFHWLIMMKAVMNDYYFDAPGYPQWLQDIDKVDLFMHKLYFCWDQATTQMAEQIEGGLHE